MREKPTLSPTTRTLCLLTALSAFLAAQLPVCAKKRSRSRQMCGYLVRYSVAFRGKTLWQTPGQSTIWETGESVGLPVSLEFSEGDSGSPRQYRISKNAKYYMGDGEERWDLVFERLRSSRTTPSLVQINSSGFVTSVRKHPTQWYGVLDGISAHSITMRGGHIPPLYVEQMGYFEGVFDPIKSYVGNGGKVSKYRIDSDGNTMFFINRDRVSEQVAATQRGRAVDIYSDCKGRAKYVDIQRLNGLYDFSGDRHVMAYQKVKVKNDYREAPYAFVDEFDRNGKPIKVTRMSPRVKAYGTDEELFNILRPGYRPYGGVAGVWKDPKSGLITHVFWSALEE